MTLILDEHLKLRENRPVLQNRNHFHYLLSNSLVINFSQPFFKALLKDV